MHETLIAPFDYPIYKTESELRAERDSVLANFRQYYAYDSFIFDSIISSYQTYLNDQWKIFTARRADLRGEQINNPATVSMDLTSLFDKFTIFTSGLYRYV